MAYTKITILKREQIAYFETILLKKKRDAELPNDAQRYLTNFIVFNPLQCR